MTPERAEALAPLLRAQPYITGVEWKPHPEGVNMDEWRNHYQNHLNLTDIACEFFGVPHPPREHPWLFVEPHRIARVVFHRSPRYHNWNFPWKRVYEEYHKEAVFVGHAQEHADFCHFVGPISYWHTPDMLALARAIAGCELFVGNQSSPFAVAEGLKVPTVLEIVPNPNNCHWERRGNVHGWNADVTLPPLADLPERLVGSLVARGAGYALLPEDRLAVLVRGVRETARLPGDMAELGVYRGGSAKVMAGAVPGKMLHLFDTFCGTPENDQMPGGHSAGDFPADVNQVKDHLWGYKVTFHVGRFPDTTGALPREQRFSFVHVDADTYQSTVAAIRFFWPRLVPGGLIVFDDYGWTCCPGVERAVKELLPGAPVEEGSYQAWVRKTEPMHIQCTTRSPVFEQVLTAFRARNGRRVVELGSTRDPASAASDGHSTLAFASAAEEVYSVDIDPEATALTRQLTAGYTTVAAVTMDGVRFLEAFSGPIDLLSLVGLDGPLPDPATWHLAAYRAARPHLHAGSLVLIDDAPAKGARVVPVARADGWEVVFEGPMTLLARSVAEGDS
jgi:predicted O-methyltransferase YrrM